MEITVGTGIDRVVILVYFLLVMGFGAYFGKYSKTTSDYFFGGRRFSWWLITISIVATMEIVINHQENLLPPKK